jgi:S-adenosylmethionine synthetase
MKNTIKLNINYDLNKIVELHNDLKKTTKKSNSKNLNKFTQKEVEQILDSIIEKLTITDNNITLILIAGVLQLGGSNQKSGNAVSYNLGVFFFSST